MLHIAALYTHNCTITITATFVVTFLHMCLNKHSMMIVVTE